MEDGSAMGALPDRAGVVIIGAGIVGNSMAWHLARLGWRDIVLLDKGTLPNPGGSTGHASNFIFLTDHSKEMTALTLDSVRQYQEMGVFTQSGGIEVARTPERMAELKRRTTSSMSWGIDTELLTPAEVRRSSRTSTSRSSSAASRRRGRRGRLASGGHDHARAGPGAGRAHDLGRHRGDRPRRRGRPHPRASAPTRARSRPTPWSSPAACWSPRIARWPARRSRSRRPSTR